MDDVDSRPYVYPQMDVEPTEDFFGCSNTGAYASE